MTQEIVDLDTRAKAEYPLRLRLGYPPEGATGFSCFAARRPPKCSRRYLEVSLPDIRLWCLWMVIVHEGRAAYLVDGRDMGEVGWGKEPMVAAEGHELTPLLPGTRVVPKPRRRPAGEVRSYLIWLQRYTAVGPREFTIAHLFGNERVSLAAWRTGGIPTEAPELLAPRSFSYTAKKAAPWPFS